MAVCCSRASVRSRLRSWSSLKQTDVLNGDYGLVSKGLNQFDLFFREGSSFSLVES